MVQGCNREICELREEGPVRTTSLQPHWKIRASAGTLAQGEAFAYFAGFAVHANYDIRVDLLAG
jgi:hypothetical protein